MLVHDLGASGKGRDSTRHDECENGDWVESAVGASEEGILNSTNTVDNSDCVRYVRERIGGKYSIAP